MNLHIKKIQMTKYQNTHRRSKNYDILPEDFEGDDYTIWFW